ncbi:hypothetical protein Poli38472_002472 [Pythium oligandrum]|uniref:RBR-type E3 ubiquitin transferase n=1 Tax=Pythium oligandrum TaxID=41045 RepID=A0A8K1CHA1_PYTOL|nr:hypothetical protein Poli38472_002472 [Pythium oligandrum]|eukprot:TMW63531.1 hypothetical protein Poli38472_002472 [Pythium oligandrum]
MTDAKTAFLDAFDASLDGVFTISPPDAFMLQGLFLSAMVECSGPHEVAGILLQLHRRLDAVGPFTDSTLAEAEQQRWTWLLMELQLMVEIDAMRCDSRVAAEVTRLGQRIEAGNDTELTIRIDSAEVEMPLPEGTTIWDNVKRSFRDSTRLTLRRLASDESTSSADDRASGHVDHSSRRKRNRALSADDKVVPLLQRGSGSNVSDSMPSIFRSVTALMGMAIEETFLCQICYENNSLANSIELITCGHRFCIQCFKMYLEFKIVDGQVYPACFHEIGEVDDASGKRKACGARIEPSEIELLVNSEVWKKYLTFKFNKENQYGRQCPYCGYSQLCAGPEHPECICESCGKAYCFTHGNAHASSSCADYEMRQLESEKLNRSAIAKISKPCPGCKSNVEKSGGCNHMKCIVCETNFCWICGAVVDSAVAPTHFQWWNLRGCAGQQMDDVENQTERERFWWFVFRIAFFVILGPPAFVITLFFMVISCFFLPCMKVFDTSFVQVFTSFLTGVAMSLFMLLLGMAMLVAFVVGILFEALKAIVLGLSKCCCGWHHRTRGQRNEDKGTEHSALENGQERSAPPA